MKRAGWPLPPLPPPPPPGVLLADDGCPPDAASTPSPPLHARDELGGCIAPTEATDGVPDCAVALLQRPAAAAAAAERSTRYSASSAASTSRKSGRSAAEKAKQCAVIAHSAGVAALSGTGGRASVPLPILTMSRNTGASASAYGRCRNSSSQSTTCRVGAGV